MVSLCFFDEEKKSFTPEPFFLMYRPTNQPTPYQIPASFSYFFSLFAFQKEKNVSAVE